jgi:hypothetical protein
MTKRAIIRWWVWGLVAIMPGTILIPPSAVALAGPRSRRERRVRADDGGRKRQQVGLPTIGDE